MWTPVKDHPVDLTEWMQLANQQIRVRHAVGGAIVFWPSGVRTLVQYFVPVVVSEIQLRQHVFRPEILMAHMSENLLNSAAEFRRSMRPQPGWLIVTKKGRKQAKRVKAVAWIRLSGYNGPVPERGDRI